MYYDFERSNPMGAGLIFRQERHGQYPEPAELTKLLESDECTDHIRERIKDLRELMVL